MPRLKQVQSLEKMSLRVLREFVVNYCFKLSAEGSLDNFRIGISIIKKFISNYVPWSLLTDFCDGFLDEFSSNERPASHQKAALDIIMDIEIPGLRLRGPNVAHLDPKDSHRLLRLEELDLSHFPTDVPMSLNDFKLNDLTTLIFPNNCTDHDLTVIGRNCSKLQVLKIRESKITDKGLSALSPCSELRVVDIANCPVSYIGIHSLLSVHKKIEEFSYWDGTGNPGCNVLSHLDSLVCPSINRFVYEYERDSRALDLPTIVKQLPNLSNLKIVSANIEDLSILRSLDKLVELEIHFSYNTYYYEVEETWDSLQLLLTSIGSKITSLKLSCWDVGFLWHQDDLDFIFHNCPNIEHLAFDQVGGPVIIPPFQKLKKLCPRIPVELELQIEIIDDSELEFEKLPSLETLSVINYRMNLQTLEAIMLDYNKFPNLSLIETNRLTPEDLEHIELTARNHNLDFKIKNYRVPNWYVEYIFGDDSSDNTDDDAEDAE